MTRLSGGAIAVGMFGLAACSSSSDGAATTSTAATSTAETSPTSGDTDSTPATTEGAESVTTESEVTDSEQALTSGDLRWERVSFGFVSAYVLARGNDVAIVDTGTDGLLLGQGLQALDRSWDDVRHVIITHSHGDHVGGLDLALSNGVNATGYVGAGDFAAAEAARSVGGELVAVEDGDDVLGLQIIATPGHTPGHIAVYDDEAQLLLAGDSINGDGEGTAVTGPNPRFTADQAVAESSVMRLAERQVDTILFGHGEPVIGGAGPLLQELAASL